MTEPSRWDDPAEDTDPVGRSRDELASFGQRALGRAIDFMVLAVVALAFFAPQIGTRVDDGATVPRWTQLAILGVWLVYEAGTTAWLGRTMGKLATGCRVADRRTGQNPSLARSVVRAAVVPGLLALFPVVGLLGYATALLDPSERRGLLDRLAGTVVVQAAPSSMPED